MSCKIVFLSIAMVIAVVIPRSSVAQSANLIAQTAGGNHKTEASITARYENMPLNLVLNDIAKSGGVRITYEKTMLQVVGNVTAVFERTSLPDAFAQILKGTNMRAVKVMNDEWAITSAKKEIAKSTAQGVIAGKVTDSKTGRGVFGATVSVGNDVRETTTAEDGSYRLTGVPVGVRTITLRLVGYAKQVRSITVGEGVIVTADFKLEQTANVLDQVIVTGTVAATELKAVSNAMTIITAKQIEERGITRLEQLFRGDVPGLYAINVMGGTSTGNYGQVALFSRGATAIDNDPNTTGSAGISSAGPLTNNMKMYVDGVQISDSGLKFLGQIDPKSIERIEILAGPQASTIYGAGAINGVMQIFTKRGHSRRPLFTLSLSSGLAESNYKKHAELNNYVTNASLSGLEGRISYRMGTSWNHDGNWIAGVQTNTFSADGGFNISYGSKITGDASARWSRRLSSTKGGPGGTVPVGALQADGVMSQGFGSSIVNETASTISQGGSLRLSYRQFPWWSHNLSVGFDGSSNGGYQPQPKYSNITDTTLLIFYKPGNNISQSYSSTMQLPLLSLANLNLAFGGDHTRSDLNNLGWNGRQITGKILVVPDNNGNAIQSYQTKPNKHSGVFVHGTLGIKDALFLTYGVRADWDPAFGKDADVKPSKYGATFNQEFGPVTAKLRGTYGRSVRTPKRDLTKGRLISEVSNLVQKFGMYYRDLPNPDLLPEDQQGGEGGMDLYFGNRGSLSVTRYNQTINNLIERFFADSVRSLLPSAPSSFNCDARTNGLDFYFDEEGYCYKYQTQSVNVGSVRNQGWELTGNMNLGPITTTGTYTWAKSRLLGITPQYRAILADYVGPKFQAGAPFQYFPEHTWAFGVTYNNSASMIGLHFNGHGTTLIPIASTVLNITTSASNRTTYTRERAGLPNGVAQLTVPGYGSADLNARHSFSSRINASLNVSNLTNYYRNDYNASFPAQGRTTRLGVNVNW